MSEPTPQTPPASVVISPSGTPVVAPANALVAALESFAADVVKIPAATPATTGADVLQVVRDELDHFSNENLLPVFEGIVKDALDSKFPGASASPILGEAATLLSGVASVVPAADRKYVNYFLFVLGIVLAAVVYQSGNHLEAPYAFIISALGLEPSRA